MSEKFNCFAHGPKACTVLKEKICKKGSALFIKQKKNLQRMILMQSLNFKPNMANKKGRNVWSVTAKGEKLGAFQNIVILLYKKGR